MNKAAENSGQGTCETCVHYRIPAPLSAICRNQVRGSYGELVKALDDAAKQDYARLEEERLALTHGGAEDGVWRIRPRATPYCALYENSEFFYVTHIKNPNGECPDYKQTTYTPADCRTCSNLCRAAGETADARILQRLADAQIAAPQIGAVAQERERVFAFIASRKASEVNEAYRNAGCLSDQPRYLDWCQARSEPSKFWVAEALNTQGSCSSYTASSEKPLSGPPADPAHRKTAYAADESTDMSKSDAVSIAASALTESLREQSREVVRMALTTLHSQACDLFGLKTHRENAENKILINGTPPLTIEMVRRSCSVMERRSGRPLSSKERSAHQALLESTWSKNDRATIDSHLEMIRNYSAMDRRDA
jgi:hypothetical protein